VPCGYCSSRTLRRDHHTGVVRCRTCGDTKTDDAYDAFLEAALAAYETVEVVAGAAA
jgi:ribosomal protein L37AE/L43A